MTGRHNFIIAGSFQVVQCDAHCKLVNPLCGLLTLLPCL
jgi:hypothetical protein